MVSWRQDGIKYKKNQIYLDVIEKLNMIVNSNGTVVKSEIIGQIKAKSELSGMPELKLGLNDKAMFQSQGRTPKCKQIEFDDIKFH